MLLTYGVMKINAKKTHMMMFSLRNKVSDTLTETEYRKAC